MKAVGAKAKGGVCVKVWPAIPPELPFAARGRARSGRGSGPLAEHSLRFGVSKPQTFIKLMRPGALLAATDRQLGGSALHGPIVNGFHQSLSDAFPPPSLVHQQPANLNAVIGLQKLGEKTMN